MNVVRAGKTWLLSRIALTRGPREAVYLTFDDGPDPRFTRPILDVLDRYRVQATFFMIGKAMAQHADIAAEVARRGHCIGAHSYAHRNLRHLSRAEIDTDIAQLNAIANMRLYRPPYGGLSFTAVRALRAAGKRIVMWSKESRDSFATTHDEVVANLAPARVHAGDIILMHDDTELSLLALPTVLQNLTAAGFRFAPLPQ